MPSWSSSEPRLIGGKIEHFCKCERRLTVQTTTIRKNPVTRFVSCSVCNVYNFLDDDLPSEYYKDLLNSSSTSNLSLLLLLLCTGPAVGDDKEALAFKKDDPYALANKDALAIEIKLLDGSLLDTMSEELYTISSELLVSKEDGPSILSKSELLSKLMV
ncbi:hypothetical protein Tco_0849855 [Tanacetum coccineum]